MASGLGVKTLYAKVLTKQVARIVTHMGFTMVGPFAYKELINEF